MAWGLPKLPGLTFPDPTKTQYHMKSTLRYYQGHRFPDSEVKGPGGAPTDVDSNAFTYTDDSVNYDPSLTYGRVKQPALPAVIPHWVHYDKRCLNFTSFMKQPVYESPKEKFRVRIFNIVYFLEDDTLTVIEPRVQNSGLWQGRLIKRGKIPKNDMGEFWHWKDLNIGKDICIYGKVFHTISCDLFTKEWLLSQGIEIAKDEDLPEDEFSQHERWKNTRPPTRHHIKPDPLRRYLEYDGKVLTFECVWDTREEENGEMREYKLLYFLQDDTVAIKELYDDKGGRDPFPLLLKRIKLPKNWKERPVSFPRIALEVTEEEVTEYYAPRDLIVGDTVFVLGRRFLICDCDGFTRLYYKSMLNVDQPPKVDVKRDTIKKPPKYIPPHIGIGYPEDTLQSCFGLRPKPPYKDIIKYNLNANKNLRYLCELDWIHPEDEGRKFVMSYSLADGQMRIGEVPRRNSGICEGTFLKSMRLQTPDSDPNFPTYYTPDMFYIGAIIPIFKHRFRIIGCDLYVYRYMCANPEKFPRDVVDTVRNYHLSEGNLKDDLEEAAREEQAAEVRAQLAKFGSAAEAQPSDMERCLAELRVEEGSATPLRPPTPPATTDRISYDDSLRIVRQTKPVCDNVQQLKGILRSGAARDDHQKVVCFTGPATGDGAKPPQRAPQMYPPGQQPLMAPEEDFCDKYQMPDALERAKRREERICAYPPSPAATSLVPDSAAPVKTGYLSSLGVECAKIPDYMRMPADTYERAKTLRTEVPDISPAARRVADLPREPAPSVEACATPSPDGVCNPAPNEDVAFACSHVQLRSPCCDPDARQKTA